MPKDDFEVRSYAYQCTDESGEGFVLAYFNGNPEVPDDTILRNGKTYRRVEHLRVDYDSIPVHQRNALAKMRSICRVCEAPQAEKMNHNMNHKT